MQRVLIFCLSLGISGMLNQVFASQQKQAAEALDKLNEAKSYIRVKPAKSLAILEQYQQHLALLTVEQQILWQLVKIGASQQLHQLEQAEPALHHLLSLRQTPAFQQKLTPITSAFGSWFIRAGYAEAARLSFLCALEHTKDSRHQLGILSNLAIVYRELEQPDTAAALIKMALKISSQAQYQLHAAIIQNNLGILYLDQGRFELAAKHFLIALNHNQSIMRHSGQIRSGSNLLLAYLYLDQQQNYLRLLPRVQRLFNTDTHDSKKAYLKLLTSTYAQRQGKTFSPQQQGQLQQAYAQLDDAALQRTLIPLAKELNLELIHAQPQANKVYSGDWLQQIPGCDWSKYQQPDYLQQLPGFVQTSD